MTAPAVRPAVDGDQLMAHWPKLVSHARRLLPGAAYATAEDIASETIARALTRYDSRSGDGNLSAWLYRVATNLVIDMTRLKASTELPLLDVKLVAREFPPGSDVHVSMLDLGPALDFLTYRQRAMFMRQESGYGLEEAGAFLGLTRTAAKNLVYRARQELRGRLKALGE